MNERPLIVEMVGIAGAGKTTLKKALGQRNPRIQAVVPPDKATYLPFLMRNTCRWLPIHLRNHRHSRWFTAKETRLMGYLETWAPCLRRQALARNAVVVLDPGSVYWLSALREFGPEITRCRSYERWWNDMLSRWAATLYMIIWLDASDELLHERVLNRIERHEAQEQPRHEALRCFSRYRSWYGRVIAEMAVIASPRVLQFRTDQISTEQMADRVLAVLNL